MVVVLLVCFSCGFGVTSVCGTLDLDCVVAVLFWLVVLFAMFVGCALMVCWLLFGLWYVLNLCFLLFFCVVAVLLCDCVCCCVASLILIVLFCVWCGFAPTCAWLGLFVCCWRWFFLFGC